jgi:hypothetical protein
MDKYTRVVALLSFFIGTALLIYFYFTGDNTTFYLVAFFVFFALIINLINVFILIYLVVKRNKKSHKISLIITLANLPIVTIYIFLFPYLGMNGTRVDIVNVSGSKISNVYITGPEQKSIGTLKIDEKISLGWMSLSDGSIDVHYVIQGDTITENIWRFESEENGYNMITSIAFEIGLKKRKKQ